MCEEVLFWIAYKHWKFLKKMCFLFSCVALGVGDLWDVILVSECQKFMEYYILFTHCIQI